MISALPRILQRAKRDWTCKVHILFECCSWMIVSKLMTVDLSHAGFTYISHRSCLTGDELPQGTNAEDVYANECIDLVLNLVGAKRGVVHNITFRRRLADNQADLTYVAPRGGEQDQAIAKMPKDRLLGVFLLLHIIACRRALTEEQSMGGTTTPANHRGTPMWT